MFQRPTETRHKLLRFEGESLTLKTTRERGCMGRVTNAWLPFLLGHVIEVVTDPADGWFPERTSLVLRPKGSFGSQPTGV
jgi:hypothetical protein